jgi:hypothetical protein
MRLTYPATLENGPAEGVGRWAITIGHATVRGVVVKGRDLDLEVNAAELSRLQINSPAFPGWTLFLDGHPVESVATRGYLAVDVPPGTHRVRALFANTPLRTAANSVSVASTMIALVTVTLISRRP